MGWVLNPANADAIDVLRWSTIGGLSTFGFGDENPSVTWGCCANNLGPADIAARVSPLVPAGTTTCGGFRGLKRSTREKYCHRW